MPFLIFLYIPEPLFNRLLASLIWSWRIWTQSLGPGSLSTWLAVQYFSVKTEIKRYHLFETCHQKWKKGDGENFNQNTWNYSIVRNNLIAKCRILRIKPNSAFHKFIIQKWLGCKSITGMASLLHIKSCPREMFYTWYLHEFHTKRWQKSNSVLRTSLRCSRHL